MAEQGNSSKRELEDYPDATLVNLFSGNKLNVEKGRNFTIGRSLQCTLQIEELYISRIQCTIKYKNNNFVIYDQGSSSGTFLNSKRMSKKYSTQILKNGDVLAFGKENVMEYVYKFVLDSDSGQNFEPEDNDILEKLIKENKQLKLDNSKLINDVKKLVIDYQTLKDNMTADMNKFKETVADISELIEAYKHIFTTKEYGLESLKIQINNILGNNFVCTICSEIVIKATLGNNCNHLFCEDCITKWLNRSRLCPVCRSTINSTSNLTSLDNFMAEICELFGGSIMEQRLVLIRERKASTVVRGRQTLTGSNHQRQTSSDRT